MGKLIILPPDCQSRASYICETGLPDNYMADYSVIGLLIEPYAKAIDLLRKAGYRIQEISCGSELTFNNASSIPAVHKLLSAHNIYSEFADIADTVYQA